MLLKEIAYVLAVVRHGSMSLAAESLFISQPALSRYIKSLEGSIGTALFQRSGSGLTLTYAGELYVQAAQKIAEIYDDLRRSLNDVDEVLRGQLRIAVPIFRGSYLLPEALTQFNRAYPGIDITLLEDNERNLEPMLARGDADIVIISLPLSTPNIAYVPLLEEEVVLTVPPGHPLYNGGVPREGCRYPWVDIRSFADDFFILVRRGWRTRELIDEVFRKANFSPRRFIETNNIETAVRMSAAGLGICFSPETYVLTGPPDTSALRLFSTGQPCTKWELVAAYKKTAYLPRAAQRFIDILAEKIRKDFLGQRGPA